MGRGDPTSSAAPDCEIATSRCGRFTDPIAHGQRWWKRLLIDRQVLSDAVGEGESDRTSMHVDEQEMDGLEQISEVPCQVGLTGRVPILIPG